MNEYVGFLITVLYFILFAVVSLKMTGTKGNI